MDIEIRAHGLQLCLPAQATGPNAGALWQFVDAFVLGGAKYIARILSRSNCGYVEARGNFGGKIFQTMHRKIDASLRQGLFDLLGEHSLGADLGKGNIRDLVAGGLDDFELDFVAALTKEGADVISLPQRELGTSG